MQFLFLHNTRLFYDLLDDLLDDLWDTVYSQQSVSTTGCYSFYVEPCDVLSRAGTLAAEQDSASALYMRPESFTTDDGACLLTP